MKITRILEILGLKRTPARISSEIRLFREVEAETEREELELIKAALKHIDEIKAMSGYNDSVLLKKGNIAVSQNHLQEFHELLTLLKKILLKLRARSEKILEVKERIRNDLISIRDHSSLNEFEIKLIKYIESIEYQIDGVIGQVELLGQQDILGLQDTGSLIPQNEVSAFHARAILDDIGRSLFSINDNLFKLFQMDEELRRK